MRLLALLVAGLFAGSLFAADDKKDDPKKDDKKVKDEEAILGTWKAEKYDNGGLDDPSAESKAKAQLTFSKGGKMLMAFPEVKYEAEYELNPAAKPKAIDLSRDGKTTLAAYALDGDTLIIATTTAGRTDRPEDLKADGKGVAVMTLKRVKEEKPEPARVKWEYKVITPKGEAAEYEKQLNQLGADGWELVGVVCNGSGSQMVFKRPKP